MRQDIRLSMAGPFEAMHDGFPVVEYRVTGASYAPTWTMQIQTRGPVAGIFAVLHEFHETRLLILTEHGFGGTWNEERQRLEGLGSPAIMAYFGGMEIVAFLDSILPGWDDEPPRRISREAMRQRHNEY
ncbi:hypothetical protein [Aureimonas phyllosphaerae]|uniref:Uncharacterized protein n=1 Tax=Aureimonas phyllosphaerae TaxID=1166078 RepID=A0A7W6BU75_9HYPH|nr:hypothetical protein [Aureimonas phyllosphaerae]MBB3938104.1 hypothetical protein [Aureimonas phyllosphaerae]MBB3962111.1 hypothetical protein [Aureimonas phyllosphaerae]SFF55916.1 hypothetical protein SAMN05216566_12816 [Aureimonas phyllosphaerae]